MRQIGQHKPKRKYYILLDGRVVGTNWAVSPEKARANFWWKAVKGNDPFTPREYDPEDFDVVEEKED